MSSDQLNTTLPKKVTNYKFNGNCYTNTLPESQLPLKSLRRFCSTFDGSNSRIDKQSISIPGSSNIVAWESSDNESTESETSSENEISTGNEKRIESNDCTEKDSSKTSMSIENIILLRCRRPKSVRVNMRLDLPRKHPKSIMLYKAKSHGVS